MAFNPLANYNQGLSVAQGQRESKKQNNISRLQGLLSGQIQEGGFNPTASAELQELMSIAPAQGAATLGAFNSLEDPRKKAFFQDARTGRKLLESGDNEGFLNLITKRLDAVEKLGGDPSDVMSIMKSYGAGDIDGVISQLSQVEQMGMEQTDSKGNPFLTSPYGGVSVQSSKILGDGTVIEVLKGGRRQVVSPSGKILTGEDAKKAIAASGDQAHNRRKEIARLGQTIRREEAKEGLMTDQQRGIQKNNILRMTGLSADASTRSEAIKKATKFKLAFEKGEVNSGAGRSAASFIPGVFTSQAKFDEEFDSFVEFAARQKLKASGELRPTAEDVEGAKGAFFGISRDEDTNIQLLSDFLIGLKNEDSEFDQLIDATKNNALGEFTFTPSSGLGGTMSDADLVNKYGG